MFEKLQWELCNRAQSELRNIITHESSQLRSLVMDLSRARNWRYKKFDDGLHLLFTCTNISELHYYLQLYILDSTMDIALLLRIRTNYNLARAILTNNWWNISHKSNRLRQYIVSKNDKNSELKRKFVLITHKYKYKQLLKEWNEIGKLLNSGSGLPVLHAMSVIWTDMMFVIKKDIVKILMSGKQPNLSVELYYNDNWILFMNELLTSHQTMGFNYDWFAKTKLRLKRFEDIAMDLLNEIKMENNCTSDHSALNLSIFNKNLVSEKWNIRTSFWYEQILNEVSKMDENVGLSNNRYFEIVPAFAYLRSLMLINANNMCENLRLLNELKHRIMYKLYNHTINLLRNSTAT